MLDLDPVPSTNVGTDLERVYKARCFIASAIEELSECDLAMKYPVDSWLQYLRKVLVETRQFEVER